MINAREAGWDAAHKALPPGFRRFDRSIRSAGRRAIGAVPCRQMRPATLAFYALATLCLWAMGLAAGAPSPSMEPGAPPTRRCRRAHRRRTLHRVTE
jgi:hypothetical protein